MPNLLAYAVFWTWPLVAVLLFRRLPPSSAMAAAMVGGYLLVPTQIRYNLPLLPALDREMVPSLAAILVGLLAVSAARARSEEPYVLPGLIPRSTLVRICLAFIVLGPIGTILTNGDRLVYGPLVLPGLRPYDAGSMVLSMVSVLIPFIVARKYIAHPRDHGRLLVVIAVAALIYSLPTLWEARMSPQLNRQIYGFFPSAWIQHLRGGGFRPVVFLEHGLRLGIFLACAVIAAAACSRVQPGRRTFWLAATAWLFVTLIFAKTFGALLIATAILPIVLLCGVRTQMLAAAVIACTTLTYPMLRGLDLVPTERILTIVAAISEKEKSLGYRFKNEDLALEKVADRPIFGWGPWNRQRAYDPETGQELSTALDGAWVIIFGNGGWLRYLGQFGLITLPIVLLYVRRRSHELTLATSGLALALAANLLDILLNSNLTMLTWMMAGALVGRLEVSSVEDPEAKPAETEAIPASPYRRTFERPVTTSRTAPPERPSRTAVRPVGRYRRSRTNEP